MSGTEGLLVPFMPSYITVVAYYYLLAMIQLRAMTLNQGGIVNIAYGVFISQPIRYAWACSSYGCFILRATRHSNKLLDYGHVKERLHSSLGSFRVDIGTLSNNMKFPSQKC